MMPALIACAMLVPAAADAEAWRIFNQFDVAGDDRPAAWERWPSAADTFRKDGADPGRWQSLSHPGTERFELLSSSDFPNLRHIVNGQMVPVTDPLASAKRLVEVRLNAVSYNFIRARQLYTVEGQRRAVAQGKVDFPVGSIQLKAAWRPITSSERRGYHTLRVRLADGSTRLYGLTALNLAAKTSSGWLWASFEHTDTARHYQLRGTQISYLDATADPYCSAMRNWRRTWERAHRA